MTCQTDTFSHKRGDGFDIALQLPANFIDGHFSGWTLTAQVRTAADALVSTLECAWADAVTTRVIRCTQANTADWPVAPLYLDVQFTKMGELTLSTATVTIFCVKDITHA